MQSTQPAFSQFRSCVLLWRQPAESTDETLQKSTQPFVIKDQIRTRGDRKKELCVSKNPATERLGELPQTVWTDEANMQVEL